MNYPKKLLTSILCGSLFCLSQVSATYGQSYNEDEWWDPTDWFDGNNYEYDDRLDLDWGWDQDDYGYDDYDPNEFGVDDYRYDSDWWDDDYDYQPSTDLNYGWHYEWSPSQNRWTRQYGYYDDYYEYNPSNIQRQTQQQQRQSSQQASRQGNQRVVRGEIDRVQSLNLTDRSGNRARHQVAQIRLEDGRWVLVDLGQDRRNLRATLNEGDQLVVRGQTGRIDGRRVLMADQVQINGRSYQISQASEQRQQQASSGQSQQATFVTGRVQSAQPVSLGSSISRNHIRLQLQNGQSILVDLGTRVSLEDLDISRNDLVTVHGRRTTTNGRQVFHANTIWVNGEETRISQNMAQR